MKALVCSAVISLIATASANDATVQFNRDIRPIFVSHCTACHGGVKQAAELSFVYPEQVLPPTGWVVEPGDPAASELIARVTSDDPEIRMPPPDHGPALSEREVRLLHDWIAQGAEWQRHWAFEIPRVPQLPPVKKSKWPRRDLDRFVLARIERENLTPAPPAPPHRWLRRVSLDLIGLPPTQEQLTNFQRDLDASGEAAYERAVDRLLASAHFGERWASVWLDQVRYADSKGLGVDSPRTIWKYRDWVIQAFNNDMPYDEFTLNQIAGDLLPEPNLANLVATASHRLTHTNEEGGTDDEEFRVAAVLDRVNTTWQAWQGLTFGCVQCHSHPYDPIQHEEYYKFLAFFNNTADCDLNNDAPSVAAPLDPVNYDRAGKLDHEINELTESIWRQENETVSSSSSWSPLTQLTGSTNKSTGITTQLRGNHAEFQTSGTVEKNTDITLEATLPDQLGQLTAIRLTGMPRNLERAEVDSDWGFVWAHVAVELIPADSKTGQPLTIARVVGDEPHPFHDPQESLNAESQEGYGPYSRVHYPRKAVLILEAPVDVSPGDRLLVRLEHRTFLLGAFPLVTNRGYVEVSNGPQYAELLKDSTLKQQRERLTKLRKERESIPSVSTPILQERPAHLARPTHVFNGGAFLDKGQQVESGLPESFSAQVTHESLDRLDLAKWLVSPGNPLTARVAVNRIWARLFGVGLVATEEDFGSSGESPSHPDLLDHLAIRYQRDFDWSTKQFMRELVLSSTYRQSSEIATEIRGRDRANRLLTRGPRVRLPAETVRDQALAVSGLLNSKTLGPPVRPPIPEGVWKPFSSGDAWPKTNKNDPNRYRRSIYTYVKRSIPYPMFASFDQPSRELCAPRRLRSNTPLQALELLNSETLLECAEALAQRMADYGQTSDEQIAYGFRLAVCREPNEHELEVLRALYARKSGGAGMQAVATAILNLDEFLMN